jgi:predicted nucleotidyltransferase component of viral defense system
VPSNLAVYHVEGFHLVFLRVLETKLDRTRYVVKGGVNLRAWFGSMRYSEDLDVDAVDVETHALRETVDKLLSGPALAAMLRARGLELLRTSKPKQTDTTQRWKFEIRAQDIAPALHTKVEFSRRGVVEDYALEPVRSEIVRPHGIPAPTANHYTAAAAIRQEISALVGRRVTQARDIWDLDHLFRTAGVDPRPLAPSLQRALPEAIERVMELSRDDFRAQVVPFLAPEVQEIYESSEAWERIRELVIERLMELAA